MTIEKGLDPVVDSNTEIMVFGSFPGPISRKLGQYYADKRNDFWLIWGKVLNEYLVDYDWELRKKLLLKHKVGLWDIYESAEAKTSEDTKLKNGVPNNFESFLDEHKHIKLFLIAGDKAYKAYLRLDIGFPSHQVLSTSGGNRQFTTAEKVEEIKRILEDHNIHL